MKRYQGDMFGLFARTDAPTKGINLLVVTVNLTTTQPPKDGTPGGSIRPEKFGVMGAGCAKQLADKDPAMRKWWARQVADGAGPGFHTCLESNRNGIKRYIGFLVVKQNWWENASPELIDTGIRQMIEWVDARPEIKGVIMPYPGIGNGKLKLADVQASMDLLDDRFIVCSLPPRKGGSKATFTKPSAPRNVTPAMITREEMRTMGNEPTRQELQMILREQIQDLILPLIEADEAGYPSSDRYAVPSNDPTQAADAESLDRDGGALGTWRFNDIAEVHDSEPVRRRAKIWVRGLDADVTVFERKPDYAKDVRALIVYAPAQGETRMGFWKGVAGLEWFNS